jgi:hypothetical protein
MVVASENWVTTDFDKILGVNSEERGLNFFYHFSLSFFIGQEVEFSLSKMFDNYTKQKDRRMRFFVNKFHKLTQYLGLVESK